MENLTLQMKKMYMYSDRLQMLRSMQELCKPDSDLSAIMLPIFKQEYDKTTKLLLLQEDICVRLKVSLCTNAKLAFDGVYLTDAYQRVFVNKTLLVNS